MSKERKQDEKIRVREDYEPFKSVVSDLDERH